MKKIIMFGLILLFTFGLVACNNKDYKTPDNIRQELFDICVNVYIKINDDYNTKIKYEKQQADDVRKVLADYAGYDTNKSNLNDSEKKLVDLTYDILISKVLYDNYSSGLISDDEKQQLDEMQKEEYIKFENETIFYKNKLEENLKQFRENYLLSQ